MKRIDVLRASWGAAQIVIAERVARDELGHTGNKATIWAFRILGFRQLVQGLVTRRSHSRAVHHAGGSVDVIHVVSMLVIAAASPRRRRGALLNGGIAGLFAWSEFRQ